MGAVLLHAIGSIRHNVFLAQFGMDAGLFPKSADWLVLYGFYGLLNRVNWGLLFLQTNWYWLSTVWLALGIYIHLLRKPVGEGEPGPIGLWIRRRNAWVKRIILSLSLSMIFISSAILTLTLLWFATVSIGIVGETAGMATVESAKADYAKGCEKSKSKCVVLLKGNERIGQGYVLDSSVTHIAIFDPANLEAHSFAREGIETIWRSAPANNN